MNLSPELSGHVRVYFNEVSHLKAFSIAIHPNSDNLHTKVRRWFFDKKPPSPTMKRPQPLWVTKVGRMTEVGKCFVRTTKALLGKRITIGNLRRIAVTWAHQPNVLNEKEQQELAKSMLHDHATAKRHYAKPTADQLAEQHLSIWNKVREDARLTKKKVSPSSSLVMHADTSTSFSKGLLDLWNSLN